MNTTRLARAAACASPIRFEGLENRFMLAGDGLTGQYFDNQDFTNLKLTRVDQTVNFNWGSGSPASTIAPDTYSVRWTGQVEAKYSQTYTFYVKANDGMRLWVNDKQIVNDWTAHAATERSGTIALTAGQKYNIKLEYFEGAGTSMVQLSWSSPSQAKQIIPTGQLYSTATAAPTLPAAPSGLTATAASTSQINLAWTDNSTNESGFAIERSTDGATFSQIATVAAGVRAYSNTGLTAGTTCQYRVRAYNSAGNSAYSNTASATTPTITPTPEPTVTGNFYVSPTGSDTNSGSSTAPLKTITRAAQLAQPGNVVIIRAGTYREAVTLTRSGTVDKPITFRAETPGSVIMDVKGKTHALVANGAAYITVEGMIFRNASNYVQAKNAMVRTGNNWKIVNSTFEYADGAGLGILGNGVQIIGCKAQYNGQLGIGASYATNSIVKDTIIRGNNRGFDYDVYAGKTSASGQPITFLYNGKWYVRPGFEAGGTKFARTKNFVVDNVESYGNHGPGLWFDVENENGTVRNSHVHDNLGLDKSWQGMGIFSELSTVGGMRIEGNYVHGNTGADILIAETANVVVQNNRVVNGEIELREMSSRASTHPVKNLTIKNNLLVNSKIQTSLGTWTTGTPKLRNIVIDYNTYDVNAGATLIKWGSTNYSSLSSIRSALGFEFNGQVI